VKKKFPILTLRFPAGSDSGRIFSSIANRKSQIVNGFTLIEVLVVVTLLSLIVVALMGVFTATQKAFRSSMTQTDVLEGGRAAMDLITGDLKEMSPSLGYSNGAVNFYAAVANPLAPLYQSLIGVSNSNIQRTNVLEKFFILSRENQTWTGTGYVVDANSASGLNPLYRFSMSTNVAAADPFVLYNNFVVAVSNNNFSGMSRLLDGVVTLRVRAYDNNGYLMANTYNFSGGLATTNNNVLFLPSALGETGFFMFSNTLPSAVEIEMATLEDRTLQRAESRPAGTSRNQYLQGQAANLHVFRQRIFIPNANAAAYQ
jgi:prepilin-type N-terminal cleavage/methylation domain-containing protein